MTQWWITYYDKNDKEFGRAVADNLEELYRATTRAKKVGLRAEVTIVCVA